MTNALHGTKASGLLPVLLMLVLPAQVFNPLAASCLIGLSLLISLISGWKPWKTFTEPDALVRILAASLWIICLLRLPFSDHPSIAVRSLETKLPLLFLPGLFAYGFRLIDPQKKHYFFGALFIAGTLSAMLNSLLSLMDFNTELYCRFNGIILSDYPHWNVFFASRLSHFMHPGYGAVYLLIGCLAIQQARIKQWNIYLLPSMLLGFFLLFLASKTAYLLISLFFIYWIFFQNKHPYGRLVKLGLLGIFFSGAMLAMQLPWIRSAILEVFDQRPNQEEHSTSMRLASWQVSFSIMTSNSGLGAGPGDTEFAYAAEYKKRGLFVAAEKKLNAHNQVLQSAAMFGIPGLVINATLILLVLMRGWKYRLQSKQVFLALALVVFSSTEAILETQAGVIWFCFALACLFPGTWNSGSQAFYAVAQK